MRVNEKTRQQTWEVLQEIEEELSVTAKNRPVKYMVPHLVGGGAIPHDRKVRIIEKLEEEGAFKIRRFDDGRRIGAKDMYELTVNRAAFYNIYEKHRPKSAEPEKALDYTDNSLRREYEKKWEVIKILRSNLIAKENPKSLMIWAKSFIRGEVQTLGDAASYFAVFQQLGCFKKYGLEKKGQYYVFVDVDLDKLLGVYRTVEKHYKRFAAEYQSKHPEASKPDTFNWETVSQKNLKLAQKVIEIVLDYFELAPLNRLTQTSKMPLGKFNKENINLDDISLVLNRVEDIGVANEVLAALPDDQFEQIVRHYPLTSHEKVHGSLSSKTVLGLYVYLNVKSLEGLKRAKEIIDKRLNSNSGSTVKTNVNNEQKTMQGASKSSHALQVKTKVGLLIFNPKSGSVKLGKYQPEDNLNPKSQEAKLLKSMMTDEDYLATYEQLLNNNVSKSKTRELTFVARNLKKSLGILPRESAKNQDCIKNVRQTGYRLIT